MTELPSVRAPISILPLVLDRVSFAVRGRTIIEDVSLELTPGIRTVILGPNGAGKSVLMRLCHGLLAPSAGRVEWNGGAFAAARQAMVFQRPILLRRSALANVEYAMALRGVSPGERRQRATEALARVGLGRLAQRPARVLSGGEQQRVALARAWALSPEVLFLDEPTASLDPAATRAIEHIIDAVHRSGTKIVMSTHNLGQARRVADEIVFLHEGRLVERAPVTRFFNAPATEQAAAFIDGELL